MDVQRIILDPDPRLHTRKRAASLATCAKTAATMLRWSREGTNDGRSLSGLSSIQVALPGRVVTYATIVNGAYQWGALIDPVVVGQFMSQQSLEGCFSLPRAYAAYVLRPYSCDVEHTDPVSRTRRVVTLTDPNATRFALHEIDHLNGILMPDRIRLGIDHVRSIRP